MQFYVLKFNYS